jgi:hypothetical protein
MHVRIGHYWTTYPYATRLRFSRAWTMSAGEKCLVPTLVLCHRFGRFLLKSDLYEIFRSHDAMRLLDSGAMEYEQRVIIKFLINEFIDAHEIHTRLSAQSGEQT